MLSHFALAEFENQWLPYMTRCALNRLIDLIDHGHPFLIQNEWASSNVMGCLATHVAWNDPRTSQIQDGAGPYWLTNIAGVTPERSMVVREWDASEGKDTGLNCQLINLLRQELEQRNSSDHVESKDPASRMTAE